MTRVADLIAELREDFLDDTVQEYLWSNASLLRFLNEAVYEANTRSFLLHGKQTKQIKAGVATYNLGCNVANVREIRVGGACPLQAMTTGELNDSKSCCWTNTEGEPKAYVYENDTITLYPKPINDAVMTLTIAPEPERLDMNSDLPFNHVNTHALLYWCAYRAFLNPDLDTVFYQKAADYLAMYERHFGKAKSELMKKMSRELPNGATLMLKRIA